MKQGLRRGGVIYFAQDEITGLIKIGTTNCLRRRMKQLASETRHPIKLLGYVWGRFSKEAATHARFKAHRHHGEWFNPHPDILDYVAKPDNQGWPKHTSWTVDPARFSEMIKPFMQGDRYAE